MLPRTIFAHPRANTCFLQVDAVFLAENLVLRSTDPEVLGDGAAHGKLLGVGDHPTRRDGACLRINSVHGAPRWWESGSGGAAAIAAHRRAALVGGTSCDGCAIYRGERCPHPPYGVMIISFGNVSGKSHCIAKI
ncbi:hypothetical protein CCHOA_01790 [Corynebacterium choanae]|uniref:Uncharacterized protein n=1 Tax=Corynebacterium choanae TaxID=1862358 RepID=A0A3G6J3Y7_9CORY|nr:hypothetical protein CCHOA_01790 [Corynebacterium choanae]